MKLVQLCSAWSSALLPRHYSDHTNNIIFEDNFLLSNLVLMGKYYTIYYILACKHPRESFDWPFLLLYRRHQRLNLIAVSECFLSSLQINQQALLGNNGDGEGGPWTKRMPCCSFPTFLFLVSLEHPDVLHIYFNCQPPGCGAVKHTACFSVPSSHLLAGFCLVFCFYYFKCHPRKGHSPPLLLWPLPWVTHPVSPWFELPVLEV